ncbi:maleylpyruvate isomerase family mycothiol-dependent enzyme [Nocardioides sp. AE5]|uniref:maleylpyruvate isomerase family mycothiol-dependent enzyme n=1 Tax=Nocardioides sp. AE5 TaxID=2962573 RepID=UPI0028818E8C|nr:maleylpyruvate isomerase family mycothiol-dependent enzyme [Nocardioides sp. AE5]MDT0201531.1 maleylpyruvate isomerase family mycothiol-dependent enzyme [Nocardioides sp. AE5]
MTRLPFDAYLDHIRTESDRFHAALATTSPSARVPSCPDWNAADLLWHLTEVQDFWTHVIAHRPAAPEDHLAPVRPEQYDDLLAAFSETSARFQRVLGGADPAEAAWSWAPEQTVGFTHRRQAHEALIHRLDAELTAGSVTPLDPRLAADGVQEALSVMFAGTPEWGTFTGSGVLVRVDTLDTDHHIWTELGRFTGTDPGGRDHNEDDIAVVTDPGTEPDVVVSAAASDLDAWLWRRRDDAGITVAGDPAAYERFRRVVDQPIT